jgi:3',5'-cyclic AMP phosphodiesterase CpdA
MTPALPPLTERIDPDVAGKREFRRLMRQLLLVYADRARFVDVPDGDDGDDSGVDGFAAGGIPELEGGVAFQFEWLRDDFRKAKEVDQIQRSLQRAVEGEKGIKHWILVTPWELTPSEREWLSELGQESGLSVHHWGQAKIEELLRLCPALLARYYPDAARPLLDGFDGADFRELARSYREKVVVVHGHLKTIGLPPETVRERDSRADLRLRDLFIPLRLLREKAGSTPEELTPVLRAGRSAVVLGDPGTGKSTLLAYLALLFAGGASLDGFSAPPSTVPLFVSLRDFVRVQKTQPDLSFLAYLEARARSDLGLSQAHRAFFESALRMGEAVVLFDGLDEVGGEAARHRISAAIRAFHAEFPGCPFWVTSRIYGYASVRLPGASFAHYRVARLDDEQVNGFIARWYAIQIPDNPREQGERARSFCEAVHRTPSVRRLAHNPLLLMLMAFIHHGLRKLPQDRGELYEKCVEMLLKTWQEAKREEGAAPRALAGIDLHVQTQKDYLAHLAFFLQEKNQGGKDEEARGLLSRSEALDCLGARHWERAVRGRPGLSRGEAREEMERFLEYISDETGLLINRGGDQLSFIHLSFQEYLAAWVFTCGSDTPSGPSFFEQHLGEPAWQEVLLLRLYIVLRAPGGGGTEEFDRIIARLLRVLEERGSAPGWLTLVRALRDDLDFTDTNRRTILQRALSFWLTAPAFEGPWFSALEEVHLFAERVRDALREVLAEGWKREPPARALVCLHLAARLFGFPADAAEGLRSRGDLPEMLPDLVVFLGEPGIDALLAEQAGFADFRRALSGLDGPALYRKTLGWAAAPPAKGAAEAALGLVWGKIGAEFRSRAAFAAPRRGGGGAALFAQAGRVRSMNTFSSATLPLSGVRALEVDLPGEEARPAVRLLCERLSRERLETAGKEEPWAELAAWMVGFIRDGLELFRASGTLDLAVVRELAGAFIRAFVRAFVRASVRAFVRMFVRAFVREFGRELGREFSHAFGREFGHAFGRDFGPDFIRAFVRDFGRAFGRDFGRAFGRDFGRAFGRDFGGAFARDFGDDFGVDTDKPGWKADWDRAMEDEGHRLRLLQRDDFWWFASLSGSDDIEPQEEAAGFSRTLYNPLALPLLLINVWNAAALQHMFTMFRHLAVIHPDGKVTDETIDVWLQRNPIEVYGVAFAWEEYARGFAEGHKTLTGADGALLLAHAAYAGLMTGLECRAPVWQGLLETCNRDDPRVRVSFALYELCHFRDEETNLRALADVLKASSAELRPILEAAGLIPDSREAPRPIAKPAATPPPPVEVQTEKVPLFAWLHLSDIHTGHKDASHRWDQALVLDVLRKDIAERISQGVPRPDALLVTGDIVFSGAADQYEAAKTWLLDIAKQSSLDKAQLFLVPGNHDVDRSVDKANRHAARLLRGIREGSEDLDSALAEPDDRALLTLRLKPYLSFAADFPSLQTPDPLFWSHPLVTPSGLRIRLIGLNTALLAADDLDRGKLRLGKEALARTLTGIGEDELVIALSHHPFRDGWLADQREADSWLKGRAHVHLSGHVHEADSEETRGGFGTSLIRIAAGAVHGDKLPPGVPASHGYSFAAVIAGDDGALRLRVWPRRWSEKNKCFTVDTDNTPKDRPFAEHPLPGLRFAAAAHPRPRP